MNLKDLETKISQFRGEYYSQLKQDVFVLNLKDFKNSGYFVEIGAHDGIYLSNTLLLERKYSWKGILCEPVKSFQTKLKENRNSLIDTRAVYKESNLKVEFRELVDSKDLSGIIHTFSKDNHTKKRNNSLSESYLVDTISLNDLLESYQAPNNIDYISIDTEGSEFDILSTFNFDKYAVNIFTIEHNYIEEKRNKIFELLTSKNYKRILTDISKWDDWYILK